MKSRLPPEVRLHYGDRSVTAFLHFLKNRTSSFHRKRYHFLPSRCLLTSKIMSHSPCSPLAHSKPPCDQTTDKSVQQQTTSVSDRVATDTDSGIAACEKIVADNSLAVRSTEILGGTAMHLSHERSELSMGSCQSSSSASTSTRSVVRKLRSKEKTKTRGEGKSETLTCYCKRSKLETSRKWYTIQNKDMKWNSLHLSVDGADFSDPKLSEEQLHKAQSLQRVACIIIDNTDAEKLLNERDLNGRTALHFAVQNGNLLLSRRLKILGADVNTVDYYGNTALHFAVLRDNKRIVTELVMDLRESEKPLLEEIRKERLGASASKETDERNVEQFFNIKQVNLEVQNCEGKAPIYLAVENGFAEIVELLVKLGASGNSPENCAGMTSLHRAVQIGDLRIVEKLVEGNRRIDLNAKTYSGRTALSLALSDGKDEIAECLKRFGAKEADNSDGEAEIDEDNY